MKFEKIGKTAQIAPAYPTDWISKVNVIYDIFWTKNWSEWPNFQATQRKLAKFREERGWNYFPHVYFTISNHFPSKLVTTEGYRGEENKRVMLEVPSSGVTSPGFWNLFYNWWTIRTEMNWKLAYMLHWNPPLWYSEGTIIFRPFWHNFLGQFVSKIGKYCLGWLRLFSSCHIFLREG